jgi:hypothetical protein
VVEVGFMSASGACEPVSEVFRESLSEVAEVLAAVVVAIQVARNGGDAAFAIISSCPIEVVALKC